MHILLFSHSHTSSLTRSHTHPIPSRDIIALCNIPTTLCCLVHSDTIPLHRRNRKPGRKGFTKANLWLSQQTCNFYASDMQKHTPIHTKHQSPVISMFNSHKDERHSNNQAFHHCLFLISSFLMVFRV